MAINKNDIKLFQAQDNTDNNSGGGQRTANEVIDGEVNNLFPDISRIDTVSGDVALRKVFPTVLTTNQDVYYGAHGLIRKVPTDPNVSALLFHTDSPTDQRIDAQDAIESYVVASYLEEFYLYGNHVSGAKAVTFLQTLESLPPNVGEVYLLIEPNGFEQYIRISSVDTQEITLTYPSGGGFTSHERRRIICVIDQALEYSFTGSAFAPSGQLADTADTWGTQVADAAKFYSTKTLLEDAAVDDTVIKVDSIFEQLVPASTKQTPLINKTPLVQGKGLIKTGNIINVAVTVSSSGETYSVGSPIVPNSLTSVSNTGYFDDGEGNIVNPSGTIYGSVDYINGTISHQLGSGGFNHTFEVGTVFDAKIQFTGEIKITQENVGSVFIERLSPLPSIGNVYVDYRSNGKWYRFASTGVRTAGNEPLGGDANIGAGSLNDNTDGTGTVNITLASIPDIDSSVIISWGTQEHLSERTTLIDTETTFGLEMTLPHGGIDPLSFVMQLHSAAHNAYKSVTALADGTLVDATPSPYTLKGRLDFANGKVLISEVGQGSRFQDVNYTDSVIIDYDYAVLTDVDVGGVKEVVAHWAAVGDQVPFLTGGEGDGSITFEIGETVIVEGLRIYASIKNPPNILNADTTPNNLTLQADAAGNLRVYTGKVGSTIYGTVNAAGLVSIILPSVWRSKFTGLAYTGQFSTAPTYSTQSLQYIFSTLASGGAIRVEYQTSVAASYPLSHNFTGKYEDISKYKVQTLADIVGEVYFTATQDAESKEHYSKEGVIYNDNKTAVGVIDYATGAIEFDCWTAPELMYFKFDSLFTNDGNSEGTVWSFTFRTSATKLTTSSFQLSYQTANGTFIATSDGNGVITGTDIDSGESYVDTQTGMAFIVFTEQVVPSSIRYDAVSETSLPLDPELLGLNPVRLPADGRVPVFKAGYHVIVFNEVETNTTNATPLANDIETLARSGQAHIEVIDVNGARLDPVQYVADRDLGTVTFSPTLVLEDKYSNALTAPFRIVDRVEDMLLATDVQINGLISLSAGLSVNYTQGVTKVASVLVWGDTGARVYNLFAQEIWNSGAPVWDDTRIGDNTTAQYDDLNNPLQIDNQSSTSGRWAIIFKSSTTVDVVHEKLGVVDSNVAITIDDVAPINPATGSPYFTMLKEGFGSGWVTNNVIRFNTDSGDNNMWVIRTVKSGKLTEATDNIELEVRGDAN